MINAPTTLEEAKRTRYGAWAGCPKGHAFKEDCCAYEVRAQVGWLHGQCSRRPTQGLFCTQHAKKINSKKQLELDVRNNA